jgi:hypothetical protein
VEFPDKTRRSLQQYDSPPLRVLGGKVFFTLVYSSSGTGHSALHIESKESTAGT